MVGIVKPSPSVSGRSVPVFKPAHRRRRAANRCHTRRPHAQTDNRRPRKTADRRFPTQRTTTPPPRRRRGHALTSDSSVSEAAFELHSSRPGCPPSRQKSLSFNEVLAERPFRLAKFTACRKKFAFLSMWRREVKAVNGNHRYRLQANFEGKLPRCIRTRGG